MSNSEDYLDSLLAGAMEQNYKDMMDIQRVPSASELEPKEDTVLDVSDSDAEVIDASVFGDSIADDSTSSDVSIDDLAASASALDEAVLDTASLDDLASVSMADVDLLSESEEPKLDLNMSIADAMMENLTIEDALNRKNGIADIQDMKYATSMEDMDFSLEEIEQRLAMASDISDKEDISKRVEDMDVTDAIDSLEIDDPIIQEIGQTLKKSDEGELVDSSILEAKEERIRALEREEMEKENQENEIEKSAALASSDQEYEGDGEALDVEVDSKKKRKKKKKKDKKEKSAVGGLKALFGFFGKKKAKEEVLEIAENEAGVIAAGGASAMVEADIDNILASLDDNYETPKVADSNNAEMTAGKSASLDETSVTSKESAEPFGASEPMQQSMTTLQDEMELNDDQLLEDALNSPEAVGEINLDEALSEAAGDFGKNDKAEGGAVASGAADTKAGGESDSASEGAEADEGKKKKPGIFAKLLAMLTDEIEEEEPAAAKTTEAAEGSGLVSAENQAILDELDAEDEGKKKGKKKKEKKPKEKKEKKPKPKKEKKPKDKAKDTGKKLPKKYISVSAFLGISIFAAIMLITSYVPELVNMSNARESYYKGDYDDAFLTMYGKDLNESDQLIYDRSKTIILLDRKYESYENYKAMGMEFQALNALFSGLSKYEELKASAQELEILDKLDATRVDILNALAGYGVSESEAMEVITYSTMDYTLKLDAILAGEPYTLKNDEIRARYGLSTSVSEQSVEAVEDSSVDSASGMLLDVGSGSTMADELPEEEAYRAGEVEITHSDNTSQDQQAPENNNNEQVPTSDNVTVIVESNLFN